MQFDLIDRWHNLGPLHQFIQCLLRKVADADCPTLIPHQSLHHLPRLSKRRTLILSQWFLIWRRSPRPVHEKHIDVADVQLFQGDTQRLCGVVMPFTPELGNDGNFRSRNVAFADGTTYDVLGAIELRRVDEAIPRLEGVDDGVL